MFVLPMKTAPAAASLPTTVASYGGSQPARIFDEQVVGTPRVQSRSFNATGTPARGPGSSPAATMPVYFGCARAGLVLHDEVEGVDIGLTFCDPSEMLLQHGARRAPALADISSRARMQRRAQPAQRRSRRLAQDPRDPKADVFHVRSL